MRSLSSSEAFHRGSPQPALTGSAVDRDSHFVCVAARTEPTCHCRPEETFALLHSASLLHRTRSRPISPSALRRATLWAFTCKLRAQLWHGFSFTEGHGMSQSIDSRRLAVLILAVATGLVHCTDDDQSPSAGGGASGAGADNAGAAGEVSAGSAGASAGKGGAAVGEAGSSGAGAEAGASGAGGEGGGHAPAVLHSILRGSFAPLPSYSGQTLSGEALLYRTLDGSTLVSIQVLGLQASTLYPSHVHNQPCSVLAGAHYMLDPAAAASESNEIWLSVLTNADGISAAEKLVPNHVARGDALSVVVHDPAAANAKMMCADLSVGSDGELSARGTFAPFAAAEAIDQTITGTVELLRSNTGTKVTLAVTGLDPAAHFDCHVHALPCGVTSAGGHYKLDPSNAATLESNELWPTLGDTSDGSANGPTSFAHRARLDAQSVVIHRESSGGTPKVACADLTVDDYPDVTVQGTSVRLPAATPDYLELSATGQLVRGLDGTTRVQLAATGLTPGVTYPAHVHNLPCAVQSGGSHYMIDKSAPAAESNELWLPLPANAQGSANARVVADHVASADARSIVIHDPNSQPAGARLACIDLH